MYSLKNGPNRANKFMFFDILNFMFLAPFLILTLSRSFSIFSESPSLYLALNCFCLSFLPAILYFLITKEPVKKVLCLKQISLKQICLIVLISFCIQPVLSFISGATSALFPATDATVSNFMFKASLHSPLLGMLFSVAVLPAIAEEIIGRGIYLAGFKNSSLKIACLMNGIFFGISHFNWEQFFYACFMGAVFAFLVRTTGSIYSSMLSHFIINSSQLLLTYIAADSVNEKELGEVLVASQNIGFKDVLFLAPSALISGVIVLLLLKKLVSISKKPHKLSPSADEPKFISPYFVLSVIFYGIYMIYIK